jgi:hypothetical protein
MATIDEINLLDYQAPTPEQILKAGRKPVAEPTPPSFNPAKDFFYNNILTPQGRNLFDTTSKVGKVALDPFNFAGGVGVISKGKGIASVISDDVARKIFDVDQEMDVLYDLNQRKKRLDNKYVFDESLDDKQYALLDKELESVNNAIQQVRNKAINKIENRFATNIQSRTIPKLDPAKVDRPSLQEIEKVAVGKANKDIIKNVGAYVDSPGFNKIYEKSYGTEKFSTRLSNIFDNSDVPIDDPKYLSTYTRLMTDEPMTKVGSKGIASLNPLEIYEKSIMPPTTMALGSTQKPFFVNPKKLADKLDKSGAGEDFFKLRMGDQGYLGVLEESIKKRGYKPEPIRIEILPSGNTTISEGNHRLYRALSRNDNEVPVIFNYTGGAERLDTPFGINQLDSFIATGEKGFKSPQEFSKYIKDVEKTYKPASKGFKIADDKVGQGISNRIQKIKKLTRELELEGGDMLPKTVKSTERKIVKLMEEIDEMSK